MMDNYYQYDQHKNKPKVTKRLTWFFWGGLIALFIIIAGIIVYSLYLVKPAEDLPTSSPRTSVFGKDISVFNSQYFQFQAGKNWSQLNTEEDGIYRYRSIREPLTEHDLAIYINPTQAQINRLKATRVQVVSITEDGEFSAATGISESCSEAGEDVKDNDVVTFNETTFTCIAGGALFDVLVSQEGGSPVLPMTRPDGEQVNIALYYRDLRATPDGRELKQIIDTFMVR